MGQLGEIVGYLCDGEIYCVRHGEERGLDKPEAEDIASPIFGQEEIDAPYHCGDQDCETLIDQRLTPDGVNYVREASLEDGSAVREWLANWDDNYPELTTDALAIWRHRLGYVITDGQAYSLSYDVSSSPSAESFRLNGRVTRELWDDLVSNYMACDVFDIHDEKPTFCALMVYVLLHWDRKPSKEWHDKASEMDSVNEAVKW